MRFIGLDVHRDFCEVAIVEDTVVRSAPKIPTTPEHLALFAQSLSPTDAVSLENTSNARAIADILRPYVARVAIADPLKVQLISHARVKTDRIDAAVLARLLAAGFLPEVDFGDEATRVLRRQISRRAALVKARTAAKNEVHAVLQRNLKPRPPMSDLFGRRGRAWLARQQLVEDEAQTVRACLRHIDLLDAEIGAIEQVLAIHAIGDASVRRLMTIPGVDVITATTLVAAIGDVTRFPTARHLVSYLGLNPTVHQSGITPARHGKISKAGSSVTRWMLVEAAWVATKTPGPLRAFAERIAARRGRNIATVAVARKLAVLCWHMLTRQSDYAFARPSLVRSKLRRLELRAGAEPKRGARGATGSSRELKTAEEALLRQAETAYRRLVADRIATVKKGAGATTGARIK